MTVSISALLASAISNHRRNLNEVLFQNQALLYHLKEGGFIREEEGSPDITEPLMYGENTTVKSFRGYDTLDITPQDNITQARYSWSQLAGSVTISGEEEFRNSGSRTQIFNLLKAKIRNLELSIKKTAGVQMFGDGTGNDGKDITGLDIAVEDGGAWSVFGNIDSNTNTWWRNQWADFSGTSWGTAATGGSTEGIRQTRTIINRASNGSDRPTLLITDQAVYEAHLAALENNIRFTDTKLGDVGFDNVTFDRIPMVWDSDIPTDDDPTKHRIFVLNRNYLHFVIGKGRNFVMSPFVRPSNQEAKVAQVILYCNLTVSNRRMHGRLSQIVV